MKATGIVRRTDRLGRVVVPKEIRDAQRWEVDTPIEMFVEKDCIVLRPYKPFAEKDEDIFMNILEEAEERADEETKEAIQKVAHFVKKHLIDKE